MMNSVVTNEDVTSPAWIDICVITLNQLAWYDREGFGGCSSVVEHQLPKLRMRVRFPSSAHGQHLVVAKQLFQSTL